MVKSLHKLCVHLILFASIGCTVAINPWFALDPINLIKMLILSCSAFALLPILVHLFRRDQETKKLIFVPFIFFIISSTIPLVFTSSPWQQQFWGFWGRSTGILTLTSLTIICLASLFISSKNSLEKVLDYFGKTGVFVTLYCVVQIMQLDPIKNWSSNLPFATLGNINFSSALLGLSNILMVGKLLHRKTVTSYKLYAYILISINTFIILYTGSIQGIAIWLAGSSILIFAKIKEATRQNLMKQKIFGMSYFPILIVVGSIVLMGTAGMGPLGALLIQQTVRFRIDYWSAGFDMSVKNLWSGVGIDSFGDFYREFRSAQATVGNPGRVTNTAHNVLLDFFSGGGLPLLVSFLLILGLAFVQLSKVLVSSDFDSPYVIVSSLFVGWITFMSISINQIGVTIWGFVFMGFLIGYKRESEEPTNSSNLNWKNSRTSKGTHKNQRVSFTNEINQHQVSPAVRVNSLLGFLIGLLIALPVNYGDFLVYKALKSGDISVTQDFTGKVVFLPTHAEKILTYLVDSGREQESVALAMEIVDWNPRSFFSWAVLAFSETAETEVRKKAASVLQALDPWNEDLKLELSSVEFGGSG